MKQKKVFLMCDPAGSGKSTYVRQHINEAKYECAHISRDEVRFSMVSEEEDYFSKEDDVFTEFCRQAQEAIDGTAEVIFINATHLNEKSRNKTLDRLNLENVELYAVNFEISTETCLGQNENRTGRSYVPRSVIRRMCACFEPAKSEGEKYKYKVLTVVER